MHLHANEDPTGHPEMGRPHSRDRSNREPTGICQPTMVRHVLALQRSVGNAAPTYWLQREEGGDSEKPDEGPMDSVETGISYADDANAVHVASKTVGQSITEVIAENAGDIGNMSEDPSSGLIATLSRRTTMRPQTRWFVPAAFLAIAVAACSGSSAAPSAATQPSAPTSTPAARIASPSAVPLPSASLPPPSATASFGGGVSGVAQGVQVNCDSPSLSGLVIRLFGATSTKDVSTTITIAAGSVTVTLDSGSGTTFAARTSTGTGVSSFDATKGAQIDSPLAEVSSASKPGSLPAISSIKATVDCGNEVPGSSTLSLAGSVPEGAIGALIDPIRVDCNPNATPATVHSLGVIKVGSTRTIIVFQATATGFTAFLAPTATTKQHVFVTTDPTVATISPTGAHVSGLAAEAGTTDTIHVSGDLVCGVVNT